MSWLQESSEKQITLKNLIIYILIAFSFSMLVRLILYYQIADNTDYFYNGNVIPLWNADGGLYGFYAKQLLSGVEYPFIAEYMPGYLLYGIVSITGITLDSALFLTPMFFASLIVIPIVLIAHQYQVAKMGFYAALIGSSMTSYYYRTHLGYYDTDMLNVFFPLMSIYFLIRLVETKNVMNALFASLMLMVFSLWYHSSNAIILSIIATSVFYLLVFERKSVYLYQSIILLSVVLAPIAIIYKLFALIVLGFILKFVTYLKSLDYRYYLGLFSILFVLFVMLVDSSQYYERANDYIQKSALIEVTSKEEVFKFKSDLSTVMEAQSIDFVDFTYRVSGAMPMFILAFLGYLLLLRRHKSMLFTLPLVLLMFVGMFAGLRFIVYGVMIFSFALVYATYNVFAFALTKWGELSKQTSFLFGHLFLIAVMYFSLSHIWNYNKLALAPTFFKTPEDMRVLEALEKSTKNNDFVLSWWDYGWPLWYYTNLKTLIDNGKHQQDNFIVSKILLSESQTFTKNASIFFTEKYFEGQTKGFPRVMDYFVHHYSLNHLKALKSPSVELPNANREIYILLHQYMLSSLSTIESFSNLNLQTGQLYKSNYLRLGTLRKPYENVKTTLSTDNYSINLLNGEVTSKEGVLSFKKASFIKNNKIVFEKSYLASSLNSQYLVVVNNQAMVLNENLYKSFLIQALIFQNYDSKYFSKVAQTENFLILKVKQ